MTDDIQPQGSLKALERYRNDPIFAAMTELLVQQALQHKLTAGELRDIAYVAAIKVEEITTRGLYVKP